MILVGNSLLKWFFLQSVHIYIKQEMYTLWQFSNIFPTTHANKIQICLRYNYKIKFKRAKEVKLFIRSYLIWTYVSLNECKLHLWLFTKSVFPNSHFDLMQRKKENRRKITSNNSSA